MPCHCQASDPTSSLPAGADGCPADEPTVSVFMAGLEILRGAITHDQKTYRSISELLRDEVTTSTIRRLLAEPEVPSSTTTEGNAATRLSHLALPPPSISPTDLLTQSINEGKEATHEFTSANHDSRE